MVTEENQIIKTIEFVMEFGGLGFFDKMKKILRFFFSVRKKYISTYLSCTVVGTKHAGRQKRTVVGGV